MSFFFFFFKQKTAYEMRISDWSSDVCSSDLSPADNDPFQQSIAAGRLHKLKAMDLAEDLGGGRYRLADRLEDTLRRMGERGDIIRLMQRELDRKSTRLKSSH